MKLESASSVIAVAASEEQADAVGTWLHMEICIEGLPVTAMVDTGAQSTIISRETLHVVNQHLKQEERTLPPLELPTVQLYGKDGRKGGQELLIIAQVPLVLSHGTKHVSVPVFVQPNSSQACLLGINAIPLLGLSILQGDGTPVLSHGQNSNASEVATVSLIESVTLPSQKGRMMRAKVLSPVDSGKDLLFEPDHNLLTPLGVDAYERVVARGDDGSVWLSAQNYHGITAHLEAGMQLGTVRPTEVVALDSVSISENACGSCNAPVKAVENTPKRLEQLCCVLNLPSSTASPGEVAKLRALIAEFSFFLH